MSHNIYIAESVAALGFSIDRFEMPNETCYCLMKFFFQNLSLKIDGFGKIHRTHANGTIEN